MSQFFFNQRASLVNDVIEGTIIASPWNNLARLESDRRSGWWSVAI
ncbi:dihydroxyacetone kinase, ATP-dependent [Klebsiella variicola]|uniref:Dihydroxyacetone kinase, ATP-dependent n=1 Tax=Klebsiella variicola TaxID=244366 RepID=A0A7H4M7X1_KLEVA|nr:dihydroxyacetone kinase, ATP-dependent [Klebsiella variicola]